MTAEEAKQAQYVGTQIYNLGTNHDLVQANTVRVKIADGSYLLRIDPWHLDTQQVIVRYDHDEGALLREAIELKLPVLRSGHTWFHPRNLETDTDYEYIYAQLGNQINGNTFTLDLDTIFNEMFTKAQMEALYVQQRDVKETQVHGAVASPAFKRVNTMPMLVQAIAAAFAQEMVVKQQRDAQQQLLKQSHEFPNGHIACPLSSLKGMKVWGRLLDPKIRIQQLPNEVLPAGVKLSFEYGKERGVQLQSLISQLESHGYEEVFIPCHVEEWKATANNAKNVQQQKKGRPLNHRGSRDEFLGFHARKMH